MNIGIDAYPLFAEKNTGIGNVVLSAIEELSKYDRKNRYILYTPRVRQEKHAEIITENPNFDIREIKGFFSGSRKLWLQSPQLAARMRKDNLDIFWGGGEYIPILTPKKTIAVSMIHDVVFKLFPETVSACNMLFYRTLLPLCLKRADRCLSVSKTSGKEISDLLGFDSGKIDVIHNRIDTKAYRPSGKKKIVKKHLLFVGTLQPRKNLVNVVKGYVKYFADDGIPLVIIGASGWKENSIRDYIDTIPHDIRKRIIFKGFISRTELVKYYQEAVALLNPSLHEGFGLCIAEAMAAGSAVIASRRGAIPELFGSSVMYADPESPDSIGKAMRTMVTDVSKRKTFEKKGLQKVAEYDIPLLGKEYAAYFERLFRERKGEKALS
jgi:glycosyltransferase involved in cell wall biosynthesis